MNGALKQRLWATTSGSVVRKLGQHVAASEAEYGDRIPGFCIPVVGEGICGVGFVKEFMKTHGSEERLGLLIVLSLRQLSLLMVVRQWQRLGIVMDHSGGFVLPVTVICCEGERQEKNETAMVLFLTIGFLFFHVSLIYLKLGGNGRYSNCLLPERSYAA